MITPRFKLTQDDNFITINIRAPYCSLRELEVDAEDEVFLFACKPYYLRLNLPGKIVDDDRKKISFHNDSGEFSFTYPKLHAGEHFKDLHLITKFLASKVEAVYGDGSVPIEVVSESHTEEIDLDKQKGAKDPEFGFGFALRLHKDFVKVSSEFDDVFEVNPCETPLPARRRQRIQYEQGKFNVDHYMCDYIDDGEIQQIISQDCPFKAENQQGVFSFTDKELDFLKNLPNIQYNLSLEGINYCHNSLIDILFAYCYDQRTTFYESTSESGWTIAKIASSLSWLDGFNNPKDVLISAFRRVMIFPLYRHFILAQTVFDDLKALINQEEAYIVRVLIKIYNIFLHGDCNRYILNNLFIKDYIIYIMKWDQALWRKKVADIMAITIAKEDLGLNLAEIEEAYKSGNNLRSLRDDGGDSDDSSSSSEDSLDFSSSSDTELDSDDSCDPCEALANLTI